MTKLLAHGGGSGASAPEVQAESGRHLAGGSGGQSAHHHGPDRSHSGPGVVLLSAQSSVARDPAGLGWRQEKPKPQLPGEEPGPSPTSLKKLRSHRHRQEAAVAREQPLWGAVRRSCSAEGGRVLGSAGTSTQHRSCRRSKAPLPALPAGTAGAAGSQALWGQAGPRAQLSQQRQ